MTIGYVDDDVMDVYLQYIADNGDTLNLCSALPTNYTEATSTYMLAQLTGLTSGDYTLAAGDVSGRKITLDAQTGIVVSVEGTPVVAAITDSGNSKLLAYAPCSEFVIYVGNTVNTTVFELELQDVA
jgi:hypothetical protein